MMEDVLIVQENEYCQSNKITIFIGVIYAYKGLLLVSTKLLTLIIMIERNLMGKNMCDICLMQIFGAFLAWETRHGKFNNHSE